MKDDYALFWEVEKRNYAIHVREFAGSRKITSLRCKARCNALMTLADHRIADRGITTMVTAILIIIEITDCSPFNSFATTSNKTNKSRAHYCTIKKDAFLPEMHLKRSNSKVTFEYLICKVIHLCNFNVSFFSYF